MENTTDDLKTEILNLQAENDELREHNKNLKNKTQRQDDIIRILKSQRDLANGKKRLIHALSKVKENLEILVTSHNNFFKNDQKEKLKEIVTQYYNEISGAIDYDELRNSSSIGEK